MVVDFNKLSLWQLVLHVVCSKTWNYEIKSMETYSANESLLKFDLTIERVSRGVYAFTGDLIMTIDVNEEDDSYIEACAARSHNGVSDYRMLPFKMPRQHLFTAMNTFYKEILMETLSECSNLPVFEDKFEPPLRKGVYTITKCQFSQDGFPNHVAEGFYKIMIFGNGTVDWSISVIAQVETAH
ncbi:uncharacterized protein isoform X2 [Musca autumnalis]|uniref:uncharacterized protein isoform X2 n=1 Tax=Musca autumnalis TaxID=221902 RepID=UPI003CFA9AB7